MSCPIVARLLLVCSAFSMVAGVSGCIASTSGEPSRDARYQLDAETRGKVVALMGEPFAADLDMLYAKGRERQALEYSERRRAYDPTAAIHCLEARVKVEAAKKKGRSTENDMRNCAAACKTEAQRPASPYHAQVEPHLAVCAQGKLANEAPRHLERFERAAARVESERGTLNKTYAMAEVRGALKQAKEGLDASDPRIVAAEAKAKELEEKYSVQLEKGGAFLTRPDVIETQARIDRAKAQVADFEAAGMRKQLELAKSELHAAEAKYSLLIKEAGL